MIDATRFPSIPYRQVRSECVPASLGTAIFPFLNCPVSDFVAQAVNCWSSAIGSSDYDRISNIMEQCQQPAFLAARASARIERRHGLAGLADVLRVEEATAIISLSFASGRAPHSVCLSFEAGTFVLRDSAHTSSQFLHTGDFHEGTVDELLAHVPVGGVAGDVIVVRAL